MLFGPIEKLDADFLVARYHGPSAHAHVVSQRERADFIGSLVGQKILHVRLIEYCN